MYRIYLKDLRKVSLDSWCCKFEGHVVVVKHHDGDDDEDEVHYRLVI